VADFSDVSFRAQSALSAYTPRSTKLKTQPCRTLRCNRPHLVMAMICDL